MGFIKKLLSSETPEIQTMQAEVALGDTFQTWCRSDIGRYIIGRAEQQEISVLRELADTNPEDITRVIQLQEASKVPGMILKWIEGVIVHGENAKFQLSEPNDEDIE